MITLNHLRGLGTTPARVLFATPNGLEFVTLDQAWDGRPGRVILTRADLADAGIRFSPTGRISPRCLDTARRYINTLNTTSPAL